MKRQGAAANYRKQIEDNARALDHQTITALWSENTILKLALQNIITCKSDESTMAYALRVNLTAHKALSQTSPSKSEAVK